MANAVPIHRGRLTLNGSVLDTSNLYYVIIFYASLCLKTAELFKEEIFIGKRQRESQILSGEMAHYHPTKNC